MKTFVILLTVIAVQLKMTVAQEIQGDTVNSFRNDLKDNSVQTIFGKKQANGGYFSFNLNFAKIDQRDGMKIGGRGGWIVDHKFAIGLSGSGFFNEYIANTALRNDLDYKYGLSGGYGGIFIEPILFPKSPVHLSLPVVFGGGGVAYTSSFDNNYSWDNNSKWNDYVEDSKAFFIIEPGVELEFNLVKYFRLSLGAYYRYTSNVEMITTSKDNPAQTVQLTQKDALNGWAFGLNMKFGIF